ncbi:MAG: ABC transporter substrate-binding protein [Pseudomonadota bacterium]
MSEKRNDDIIAALKDGVADGKVSRRRFMEGALYAGLTVSAATTLWTSTVRAATPKKGGKFRVGMDDGNTTDSMDPATYESTFNINMAHTHRNFLTEITTDNVVGPELAESWDASDDASEWTFKLRKGVEFHNAKSLEASDVVDTLNYHRGDDTKSAAKALLEPITEIEAVDKHTVRIKLNAGSADFPYIMTDYHLTILPSDGEGNVQWQKGEGTGGYVVKDFDPGVRAHFERFPNYFKDDRAWFDEVEYTAIPDVNARQTAVLTGELDAMLECDLKTVHLLARDPNVAVDEVPSGTHITMPMHVDVAPFDNVDVRLALKYSIDRDEALAKILKGHGTLGNDHPIGAVLPYYAQDLEQRIYDPDKAKHHLKKAGMENLQVSFSTSDVPLPGGVDLAILFQENAASSGITIDVEREPNDGYWSNVWLVKPFCLVSWGQRPTPDVMFSLAYAADAAWNESHYKGKRFNELLIQARAELDDAKRRDMYFEMQQIMRDDGGTIIPFFRNYVYARRANVAHADKLSGNWALDGARGAERWWFG